MLGNYFAKSNVLKTVRLTVNKMNHKKKSINILRNNLFVICTKKVPIL